MDVATIKRTYDFGESEIFGLYWFNMFRSLGIGLDYFWDLEADSSRSGPTHLLFLQLRGCIWVNLQQTPESIEDDRAYQRNIASVIDWGLDLDIPQGLGDRGLAQPGYRYAYIMTDMLGPAHRWLEAVYSEVDVVHLSPSSPEPPR